MADAVRYLVDVAVEADMGSVAARLEAVHGELKALAVAGNGSTATGDDATIKPANHTGSKDIQ